MIAFRKSLAFRVLALTFILLALPLLADFFFLMHKRYTSQKSDIERIFIEKANQRLLPLSKIFADRVKMIKLVEYFLKLKENFPTETSEALNERLGKIAEAGRFLSIHLVQITPEGFFIPIATGSQNGISDVHKNYADFNAIYKFILANDKEYFYFIYDLPNGKYAYYYGEILHDEDKEPKGLLLFALDITESLKEILHLRNPEIPLEIALIRRDLILVSSDPKLKFQAIKPLSPDIIELLVKLKQPVPNEPLEIVCEDITFPFFEFKLENKTYFATLFTVPNTTFYLMIYSPKRAVLLLPYRDFIKAYSVYVAILIIGGIISFFLTKRMAEPLNQLVFVMTSIQKGDMAIRYREDPWGFEINHLGNTFNQMVDSLIQKKQLAEEERVKKEIYAKELKIGQQVQRGLFPRKMADYPGVEIAAKYQSAIEVGGDFYDVFLTGATSQDLALVVADASGKGVRACFYSLGARSLFRAFSEEFNDVADVVKNTNKLFCQDSGDSGMFVTSIVAFYNNKTKILRYFSSGHNPPLLYHATGQIEKLSEMGMAIGFIEEIEGKSQSVELHSGDILVLYSDGITEQHNKDFEFFSENRLMKVIQENGNKSVEEIADSVINAVKVFAKDVPQHDDITLLIMKIL